MKNKILQIEDFDWNEIQIYNNNRHPSDECRKKFNIPYRVWHQARKEGFITVKRIYNNSPIWKMPLEEFKTLAESCSTITEILAHFGFENKGRNHLTVHARLKHEGINFVSTYISRSGGKTCKKSAEEYLVIGSKVKSHFLKMKLLSENILDNVCSECGLGDEWNGKTNSFTTRSHKWRQ